MRKLLAQNRWRMWNGYTFTAGFAIAKMQDGWPWLLLAFVLISVGTNEALVRWATGPLHDAEAKW